MRKSNLILGKSFTIRCVVILMYLRSLLKDYIIKNGSSRLGSTGIAVGAFLIPPGATEPEIQLTLFSSMKEPHVATELDGKARQQALITVALLTPEAKNRVVLNDQDPDGPPDVVPEVPETYAEHLNPNDVVKLAWGVQQARAVFQQAGK